MQIVPDSIAIGYVHNYMVHERWAHNLANAALNPDNKIIAFISSQNPRQEAARNATIEKFLEGFDNGKLAAEWLMWIDTDQTFENDAPARLRKTAKRTGAQMVTGVTWVWKRHKEEMIPNTWTWDAENKWWLDNIEYEAGKTYEVDATGSACVLIHRSVFLQYPAPWHVSLDEHPASGKYMGHDLAFFYRTVVEGDLSLAWDTSVPFGHIKQFELTQANYDAYRAT